MWGGGLASLSSRDRGSWSVGVVVVGVQSSNQCVVEFGLRLVVGGGLDVVVVGV